MFSGAALLLFLSHRSLVAARLCVENSAYGLGRFSLENRVLYRVSVAVFF